MVSSVETYEIGHTPRFIVVLSDADGTTTDPDQEGGDYLMKITISRLGTTIVDAATMTRDDVGTFHYDWDTTGRDAGQYLVKCVATLNNKPVLNSEYIDLVTVE